MANLKFYHIYRNLLIIKYNVFFFIIYLFVKGKTINMKSNKKLFHLNFFQQHIPAKQKYLLLLSYLTRYKTFLKFKVELFSLILSLQSTVSTCENDKHTVFCETSFFVLFCI